MKIELSAKGEYLPEDTYVITLKRRELEQLHLLILSAGARGGQEFSRAITSAMTEKR